MYKYLSPMLHLALIAVKVGKDCYPNIKKVLNPEWYLFNTLYKVDKKEDKLILNKQYPFILNDNQPGKTNFAMNSGERISLYRQ